MYQVNVTTNYLPKINHIAGDSTQFMTLQECKEFIEMHKSILNEKGLKHTTFKIWEIKKEVNEIPINKLYDK